MPFVNLLVEGYIDEQVMRRILAAHSPIPIGDCFGKQGKNYIAQRVQTFVRSAQPNSPLICLVDLDKIPCPSAQMEHLVPGYTLQMIRFIQEAWNLDDAMKESPSLARAISAIRAFVTR